MITAQENVERIQKYFDLLYSMEMDALVDLFADDIDWFIVANGVTIKGKDRFKALAQNHWAASPDRVKEKVNIFATDKYACLEYITRGTVTGEADFVNTSIKPTGRSFELQACFVFHFRQDGKIDRVREYFDMGTVDRQIKGEVSD